MSQIQGPHGTLLLLNPSFELRALVDGPWRKMFIWRNQVICHLPMHHLDSRSHGRLVWDLMSLAHLSTWLSPACTLIN